MSLKISSQRSLALSAHASIEERALECVRLHRRLYSVSEALDFECEGKTLIVRGEAPTFYLKQLLQEALRELPGVERVDKLVEVRPRK